MGALSFFRQWHYMICGFSNKKIGMPSSYNDINMLHRSMVFSRLVQRNSSVVSYEINAYDNPYYLADCICLDWAALVKTVLNPTIEKTKMVAQRQDTCRKDVEGMFDVLQAWWDVVHHPDRTWNDQTMYEVMTACVIMYIMIVE
jgi:hypothetical protein